MAPTEKRRYRFRPVLVLPGLVALALFALLLGRQEQVDHVPVAPTLDKSEAVHKAAFRLLEELDKTATKQDEGVSPLQTQREWVNRDPLRQELLSLSRGSLAYGVPTMMQTGETETVIAKIGDSSV
ncbi:MAG TPA: hypothetical protein VI386_02545, partial [Candidatus Sulfotelmatobacter sp.]